MRPPVLVDGRGDRQLEAKPLSDGGLALLILLNGEAEEVRVIHLEGV